MLNEMFVRAYVALRSLVRDEEGASAVEYGLILGLIAVAIILVMSTLGTDLNGIFTNVSTCLTTPASC